MGEACFNDLRLARERCYAIGLERADCPQWRTAGSLYCYYHDKMAKDLLEPTAEGLYPALPLPAQGYVLTPVAELVAA